jgi:hypothetical protein
MIRQARWTAIFLSLSLPAAAHAQISALERDKLPQSGPVLAALDDAAKLEPYTDRFQDRWNFPVSKQEAATRLGQDLAALQTAVKANPDNEELRLAAGLVAHYAYNIDVPDSDTAAIDQLAAAQKLAPPADFRPAWFQADFYCQTLKTEEGANGFLALEAAHPWKDLPASFWRDYEHCAAITNMPAHLLRAADHLAQLGPAIPDDQLYAGIGHGRFADVNLKKSYPAEESWSGARSDNDIVLTSTACGVQFHIKASWHTDRLELDKGSCVAFFNTGPYSAPGGPLHPGILVLVQRPQGSETLDEYAQRFTKKGAFTPMPVPHCPAAQCSGLQGVQPGVYGKDGDSHPRVVVFERDEPPDPGLALESPTGPPTPQTSGQGVEYLRPTERLHRMAGKLFYLVTLDTASSIEAGAADDFDYFLAHLQVE